VNIGICCYPSYGGSGVVATELGIQLARLGHTVHFIAHRKPFRLGHYHPNIFFHEVEVPNYPVFVHPPYLLAMANTIRQVDDYYGLDILHAHYAVPHATAIWMGREMLKHRIPLVTTLHGTDITLMAEEPSLKEANAFSVRQSDAVTAVSESLRQQAQEVIGLGDRLHRIYNFIDEALCVRTEGSALRENLRIRPSEKVLIHTSNFRPVKRIGDIISIFAGVSQAVEARLLLIGEGPELCGARQQVAALGLEKRVSFLGNQSEVMELLSIGDLFLLPSEKESFGLAALEAMACAVPVVASDTGGLPEVVLDGVTGYTCPVGAVSCMIEKSVSILTEPGKRERMGLAGQRRAREEFGASRIVPQYVALYEQLLAEFKGVAP